MFAAIGGRVWFVGVGCDGRQLDASARGLGFEVVEYAGALGGGEIPSVGCWPRGTASLERGKRAHELLFDCGDVDVADDHDRHEFRAIPRIVEIDETFAPGRGNDGGVADWEALRKERTAQKESIGGEGGAVADRVAGAFLT